MELTDRFEVKVPANEVWALLWDLPRVAMLLPGCERIDPIDDTHYRARVTQKVGPFKVGMDVALNVDQVDEERSVVVSGGGQDRMGNRLKINRLSMSLDPHEADGTTVAYAIDFTLFGRLATLGSSVVKRKAEEIRGEFTKRLIAELEPGG